MIVRNIVGFIVVINYNDIISSEMCFVNDLACTVYYNNIQFRGGRCPHRIFCFFFYHASYNENRLRDVCFVAPMCKVSKGSDLMKQSKRFR